jgi:adenosine deaminase
MKFNQLPKVELHVHLDCSLSYNLVSRLNPEVTLDTYRKEYIAPPKCNDLADFLSRAPRGVNLMQSKQALELTVDDLFEQFQNDNIIYAEIRFGPLLHLQNGLSTEEVVQIVEAATATAIKRTGIEARLILCTLRDYSVEQSLEIVKLVHQFTGTTVAGFDIAADEAGYPIDNHVAAFKYARKHGVPCTAHAGEARGPVSLWETLKNFRPSRIGHGVRSVEDPRLMDYLKEKNIHLEICPSCNIQVDVFDRYENHSIDRLYNHGISVGVNTDARTLTNISLNEEYNKLHDVFGWSKEHFLTCNINALKASFLSEYKKRKLIKRLKEGYLKIV